MLNQCVLIGRLTEDPELRYTNEGTPVCNFNLAVERDFTNKDGDKETDFIDVVAWRKTGETSAQYLNKGRLVAVTGRIQIRKNKGKQSRTYINPEIVANKIKFLDGNNSPVDPDLKRNAKKESEHEPKNENDLESDSEDIEEEIEVPF